MRPRRRPAAGLAILCAAVLAGACQSEPKPAVLRVADEAALDRLRAAAARLLERDTVELGPEDPSRQSRISVLPPLPSLQQDRNPSVPTPIDIVLRGRECVLVRPDTGRAVPLLAVECVAVEP